MLEVLYAWDRKIVTLDGNYPYSYHREDSVSMDFNLIRVLGPLWVGPKHAQLLHSS